MALPKEKVNPDFNYTYPSERRYFDESKNTALNSTATVTDSAKSGADYGIKDEPKTQAIVEPSSS